MKLAMGRGNFTGWGVCATNLREQANFFPPVQGATVHSVSNHAMEPLCPEQWDKFNIGYFVFEDDQTVMRLASSDQYKAYDLIVTMSSWCQRKLKDAGIDAPVALQGIDHDLFKPLPLPDNEWFTVFSGGQFSFRKGQDIVLAAMKVFMERHADVRLVCSWHSAWNNVMETMAASDLIDYRHDEDTAKAIVGAIVGAGLDTRRIININAMVENTDMPQVYALADIGLFPNRCEGANNMVMSEFMACGRTVIASNRTGHAEVITENNSFPLRHYTPVALTDGDNLTAVWPVPSVGEIIETLETAYLDRSLCKAKSEWAVKTMESLTWSGTYESLYRAACGISG